MKKLLISLLILAAAQLDMCAEPVDTLLNYVRHAMAFDKIFPQEKIYLHLDNTGYFMRERIFFKAYVVNPGTGKATELSRVLYVELLNPSGDVVAKCKLPIVDGTAKGDILVTSLYQTGFYELRAYTRYMTNYGGATTYSRVIPIFRQPAKEGDYSNPRIDPENVRMRIPPRQQTADSTQLSAANRRRQDKKLRVNFYPEGGNLVAGLRSRVAFEVLDENGRHTQASGLLVDKQGATQAIVSTDVDGRGIFEVDASTALSSLVMTDAKGKRHDFALPDIKPEGCVIRADVTDDKNIMLRISATQGMQGRLAAYVVMNSGRITHTDTLTLDSEHHIALPYKGLSPGVNQFTLFTADGQIQAERLVFVTPVGDAVPSIEITNNTPEPKRCGLVSLDLQTSPNASLSFSAMDHHTLTNGHEGNIQTYMLLEGDLRGYIPSPEYYFEADDLPHRLAADTLMLINGWRRYDFQLMADIRPWGHKLQPIEDQLFVFGRLIPSKSKWIKNNRISDVTVSTTLYNSLGEHYRGTAVTDSTGAYFFALSEPIFGDWTMQMQTTINDKRKTYNVMIDRHFAPEPRFISPEETTPLPRNDANLFRRTPEMLADGDEGLGQQNILTQTGQNQFTIRTVKIKTKRHYWTDYGSAWNTERNGQRVATLYYDMDAATDEVIDKGEDIPTLAQWLSQKNSLFHYDPEYGDAPRGKYSTSGHNFDGRPIVWIVDNSFSNVTYMQRIPVDTPRIAAQYNNDLYPTFIDEIKSIYIDIENPQAIDSYITSGEILGLNPVVIFIYTHLTLSTASNKGIRRTHFSGYNVPTAFEMEDYSIMPPMEDFRRTLYWEPDLKTDGNGHAHVEFYNNSSAREMLLSVEGMDNAGHFISNK